MRIKIFVNNYGQSEINQIVEIQEEKNENFGTFSSFDQIGFNWSYLLNEAYKQLIMPKEVENFTLIFKRTSQTMDLIEFNNNSLLNWFLAQTLQSEILPLRLELVKKSEF